jgi:hypothetical protein
MTILLRNLLDHDKAKLLTLKQFRKLFFTLHSTVRAITRPAGAGWNGTRRPARHSHFSCPAEVRTMWPDRIATRRVTLAAALLGATHAANAQVNMLANPSFEGGSGNSIPGWSSFENAYASNNGDEGVYDRTGAGSGVGKLYGTFSGNYGVSGFYQQFGTTPGLSYQFHIFSYQKTGDDLTTGTADNFVLERLTFFDAGGNELTDYGVNAQILDASSPKDTWINNPTVTATAPAGAASVAGYILFIQPQFAGGAGFFDDASLVQLPQWAVDASGNWSTPSNWGLGGVPNATDAVATLGPVISDARTVTVDAPQTVGTLTFDNAAHAYTLGGPGPLSLHASTGRAAIHVRNGAHTINTRLTLDSPTTITLDTAGSNLTIGPAGQLDVKGQNLVIDYAGASPAASVVASLLSGRNGGTWDGHGIISSTAAADANHPTAIAWAEASNLLGLTGSATATWNGATVDATSLLLKYTYYGDLNFDGRVNADDYALIDRAYARHLPATWINGDVNYDGAIDAADYALMDAAFLHHGGTLSPAMLDERAQWFGPGYTALLAAAVPEPGAASLLSVAGVALLRRARRRPRP